MKVCDLMVGDLVLHDGKVIRVDAVHKRKIGYHKTKDKLTWLFSGQFEPVPLTPEILEKNGFYRREIPTRDEIGHYYHRTTDPCSIFVRMSFGDGRDFGNEIRYVHDLQHLLKLCGIDKEIVV
jgi:hypothetical protein